MKAARLHEYGKPLVLEDVPVPDIQPDDVLVQVKAGGMRRSDVQLVDGYFRKYADIPTPITLGPRDYRHRAQDRQRRAQGGRTSGGRPRGRRPRMG